MGNVTKYLYLTAFIRVIVCCLVVEMDLLSVMIYSAALLELVVLFG